MKKLPFAKPCTTNCALTSNNKTLKIGTKVGLPKEKYCQIKYILVRTTYTNVITYVYSLICISFIKYYCTQQFSEDSATLEWKNSTE